jgi:zinc protease
LPSFLDFSEKIHFWPLTDAVQLAYVRNTTPDLFEVHWIFEEGLLRNPWLPVFFNYAEQCGTAQLSLQAIKNELFKLGLQVDFTVGNEKSYVSLSGLELNFEKGIQLVYQWLLQLKPDETLWQKIAANIQTNRGNEKMEKNEILRQGMVNFAKFRYDSPYLLQPTSDELLAMPIGQLLNRFSSYFCTCAEVYFLGNLPAHNVSAVLREHNSSWTYQPQAKADRKELVTTANQVYFVDFPGVQVDCLLLSVKEQNMAVQQRFVVDCFNNYFFKKLGSPKQLLTPLMHNIRYLPCPKSAIFSRRF